MIPVVSLMQLLLAALLLGPAILLAILLWKRPSAAGLPPGPKPHILFGNKIPRHPWKYYLELSRTYGPLVTVWEGTKPVVVCNTFATYASLDESYIMAEEQGRSKSVFLISFLNVVRPTRQTERMSFWRNTLGTRRIDRGP